MHPTGHPSQSVRSEFISQPGYASVITDFITSDQDHAGSKRYENVHRWKLYPSIHPPRTTTAYLTGESYTRRGVDQCYYGLRVRP